MTSPRPRVRCRREELAQTSWSDDAPASTDPRWPVALVLAAFIAITIALRLAQPKRESLGPHWLVPSIEIALLVALVLADPARLNRRSR